MKIRVLSTALLAGLAFSQVALPDEAGMLWGMDVQTLALVGLGIIALVLGLIGWLVGRKPRLP